MKSIIQVLAIILLVVLGILIGVKSVENTYEAGYDAGFSEAYERVKGAYDRGYQACVEEYNLYLPFDY